MADDAPLTLRELRAFHGLAEDEDTPNNKKPVPGTWSQTRERFVWCWPTARIIRLSSRRGPQALSDRIGSGGQGAIELANSANCFGFRRMPIFEACLCPDVVTDLNDVK